jgi:predicted ATPase with chaperone activity
VIAAAGAHNLLMLGPPGSGKTMYIPRHCVLETAAPFRVDKQPRCVRMPAGESVGPLWK